MQGVGFGAKTSSLPLLSVSMWPFYPLHVEKQAVQPIFRSFSEGIVLYEAVYLMCPWEVSSGSFYAAILGPAFQTSTYSFTKFITTA